MKKTILILILSSAIFGNAGAQATPGTDTLGYLQNIVSNKANYIGHPFSTLQSNMQIQIKHFWPNASLSYDRTKETSTQFAFYFPQNAEEIYLTYPCLEISWQPYLNKSESNITRQSNNHRGQWNSAAASLYANCIIADIKVRN